MLAVSSCLTAVSLRALQVGRFPEPVARYFFQQLICGLAWCHSKASGRSAVLPAGHRSLLRPPAEGALSCPLQMPHHFPLPMVPLHPCCRACATAT